MGGVDLEKLERFAGELPRLFYMLMAVALLAVAVGSPGSGLMLLILGACVHVVRASIEEFVDSQRARRDEATGLLRDNASPRAERPHRSRPTASAGSLVDASRMMVRSRR